MLGEGNRYSSGISRIRVCSKAITLVETPYPNAKRWELDTILQEEKLCYLKEEWKNLINSPQRFSYGEQSNKIYEFVDTKLLKTSQSDHFTEQIFSYLKRKATKITG